MRTLLMSGLFLLCACGPSIQGEGADDGVTLRVEPTTAAPGDTVELILENGSAATVGYNLCSSGLERRAGASWETVPSDRVCTMELRLLAPGETARYPMALSSTLPAGEYRFLTNLDIEATASRSGVRSDVLRVTG